MNRDVATLVTWDEVAQALDAADPGRAHQRPEDRDGWPSATFGAFMLFSGVLFMVCCFVGAATIAAWIWSLA